MKTPPLSPRRWLVIPLFLLLCIALGPQLLRAADPERSDLQTVWQRVQASGRYDFSADVTQTVIPQPSVRNAGRESKESRLHLEGQTDLPQETLHLTLWNGGGSVMDSESGLEVKVEGPRAYARQGIRPWEEVDDFTSLFAPGGDFLSYLSAAKNIQRHEPETRETPLGPVTITRYTFDIDGPGFAEHMRKQAEEQLHAEGKLMPSTKLELAQTYVDMTGQGELWVGQDGLPIRQLFHLNLPDRRKQQTVQADIEVTFSKFDPLPTTFLPISPTTSLLRALEGAQAFLSAPQTMTTLGFILLLLAWVTLLVFHRRSRKLYAAVALSTILSMTASPLLQIRQMVAFAAEQSSKAAAQEAEQEKLEQRDAMLEQREAQQADPHQDPMRRAEAEAEARAEMEPQATVTIDSVDTTDSEYYDDSCETSPNSDADSDGLTNIEECRLGILPSYADSDGDEVDDNIEVAGFTWNNKKWYTDPQEMDSNNDGIDDLTEWETDENNDGLPDDTDSDGTPDLWDDDNDADGVPDDIDLSPYSSTKSSNTFSDSNPLQLSMDDLTVGELTTVEFQFSPTDADHLWYSYNVLDWPEDEQGQMQDADGKSFYDEDPSLDADPYDNGDVMLIPMLEIQITGDSDNLPSEAELEEYNISVVQEDDDTQSVYVPLTLVTTDEGEKNVAFYGQMIYEPEASWGTAHQVRLVWLVQAQVDSCNDYEDNICTGYDTYNDSQVIHVYDDSWFLTGMHVREERGTDVALVYEDPTVDADPRDDEAIYDLIYGLEKTFQNGSDADNDGALDITISEIYDRWNYATNSSATSTERWNIEDVLTVVKHSYETADLALQDTIVTQTLSILNSEFTSVWSSADPVYPSVLFLTSEQYRSLNLDMEKTSTTNVSWSGSSLTFSLPTTGDYAIDIEQSNSESLSPYEYDTTDGWDTMDLEDYWDILEVMLEDDFADETDEELAASYILISQLIYTNLNQGVSSLVMSGDYELDPVGDFTDASIADDIVKLARSGLKTIVSYYIKPTFSTTAAKQFYDYVKYKNPVSTWFWQTWAKGGWTQVKLVVGLIVVVLLIVALYLGALYAAWYFGGSQAVADTITYTGALIGLAAALYNLFTIVYAVVRAVKVLYDAGRAGISLATAVGQAMTLRSAAIGISKAGAIIGLVISIGLALGIFIYLWASGSIEPGTIAFNVAIAQTFAAIYVAILFFMISLSVVGAVIIAILAVVDIFLYFFLDGWTVTGWLTEVIADALYRYEVSVDVDVEMGDMDSELITAEDGYIAGNQMQYTFPLTTTLTHNTPEYSAAYLSQFTQSGIKKNSLVYELSERDVDYTDLSTSSSARYDEWITKKDRTKYGEDLYEAYLTDTLVTTVTLEAGINADAYPLYLNSAYYLYGYECTSNFMSGDTYCDSLTFDGSDSTELGETLILDVYPATLDEFMDTDSWANTMTVKDADGDGLLNSAFGGLDPDDSDWDDDNDDLSDAYELELQALSSEEGGEYLDPSKSDTDGDGLNDAKEIALGTDPASSDTDNDGLTDYIEAVTGWTFTYGTNKTITIYSNPIKSDEDGDGLDDLAEKTLHTGTSTPYHPSVWNENPIGLSTSLSDSDAILARSQSFVYTSTAANNLTVDYAARTSVDVTLPTGVSGSPTSAEMDLQMGQSQDLVSNLSVSSSASNATTNIVSAIEAQLHTPSVWDWDDALVSSATLKNNPGRAVALEQVTGWNTPFVGATLEQCGLTGTYYNSTTPSGTAVLTRCEGAWLDYEWGSGSPGTGVNSNYFSASYTGSFFLEAGSYTFYTRTDDGVRLYIDNTLVINKWINQGPTTYSSSQTLTAGLHTIKLEYYENTGGATAQFWWETEVESSFSETTGSTVVAYTVNADGVYGTGTTLNDTSVTTRVHSTPDIACNSSGKCLAVWSDYVPSTSSSGVNYALLTSGSSSPTLSTRVAMRGLTGSSQRLWKPTVSSDGTDFLVAWREYSGGSYSIKAYRVTSAGATSGSIETLYTGTSALEDVDLTWANSRYLAVWSSGTDLWHAFVSTTSGFYIPTVALSEAGVPFEIPGATLPAELDDYTRNAASTAPLQLTTSAVASEHNPTVAYDSTGQQALMVYRSTEGSTHSIVARILTGDTATEEITLATLSNAMVKAAVSPDPENGGWVIAWSTKSTIYYQALAGDGTLRGSQQQIAADDAPPNQALVCVEPRPKIEAHFEEDSGSTSFADDSGYGTSLTCTNCTAASDGYSGRGVLLSGSGKLYNSSTTLPSDNFSVSFWFKTDCQNCTLFERGDYSAYIYTVNGSLCTGSVIYNTTGYSNVICSSSSNYADGNWHQVTLASGSSISGKVLYLDGSQVGSNSNRAACSGWLCNGTGLEIADGMTGSIDEFYLYDRALSSREVDDNYTAALAVYAFDEYSSGSTVSSYSNDTGNTTYNASCVSTSTCPTTGADGQAYYGLSFDGSSDYLKVSGSSRTVSSYSYDFSTTPDSSVWSSTSRSSGTRNSATNYFLGQFSNDTVNLNLTNLPTHDSIEVSFDVYTIGSWDGNHTKNGPDYWTWGYDSTQVLNTTFSNQDNSVPNYQFYPGEPYTPDGVRLYQHSDYSGNSSFFTADDTSLSNDTIGNDSASSGIIYGDTVAILYEDSSFGGSDWIQDHGRGYYESFDNDEVTSLRVFTAANDPKTSSNSGDYMTVSSTAYPVYSISKTISSHTSDSLSLYFTGSNLEGVSNESWGIDNVKVTIKSSSVPLTNESFTLAAWTKRDTSGTNDYFISQGSASSSKGLHFGYRSSNLVTCGFYSNDLDTSSTYTDVGEWHHWACTYDASTNTRTIYRDGVQVAQGTASADYGGTGALYLGSFWGSIDYFDGTLDEVGIWTQALSAEDVYDLYAKVKILDDSVTVCEAPRASDLTSMPFEYLAMRETTTYLGTSSQEVEHEITIDGSAPTASLTTISSGEYLNGSGTLTIGGSATDSFGEVDKVELSVDSGSWQSTEGSESWSYNLNVGNLSEGSHTFQVRATDVAGNVGSASTAISAIVDRTAPTVASSLTSNTTLASSRDERGRWMLSLSGTVSDAGSGVDSVEVLLQGQGDLSGKGWQTATVSGSSWTLEYILPRFNAAGEQMVAPTGTFTLTLRATDKAGTTTAESGYTTLPIRLDNTRPTAEVTYPISTTTGISSTITLQGTVTDGGDVASGISSMQIAFTPMEQLSLLSEAELHLPMDDPSASRTFRDVSHQEHDVVCTISACPTAQQSGKLHYALSFDGNGNALAMGPVDLANQSFTIGAWAYRGSSGSNDMIFAQGSGSNNKGLHFGYRSTNTFTCAFWGNDLTTTTTYTDVNEWHHWACSYNAATNLRTIYRDGVQVAQGTASADYSGGGGTSIGSAPYWSGTFFHGRLDEVLLHTRALSAHEVEVLYEAGTQSWNSVTLAQSGSGVTSTTWTYALPGTLGDYYQIDLRAMDVLGNHTLPTDDMRGWRGEIDTQAPTLSVSATQSSSQTTYTCQATDFSLEQDTSCQLVSTDGPVLRLPFEESGTVTTFSDSSGNGYNATCSGTGCPTTGQAGQLSSAVRFDGTDDILWFNRPFAASQQELTIAAWIKPESLPARVMRFITLQSEKAVLRYGGSSSQLHFYMKINGSLQHVRVNNALTAGVFQHVAGTYDGETMRVYVNGSLAGSLSVVGTVADGSSTHFISSSGSEAFLGSMDEVRIYDRALSATEIYELYQPPLANLHLNEATGATTFSDDSGRGYSATCTGTTCPTAGQSGQVGNALTFDGTDDTLSTSSSMSTNLATGDFTIGAWVKTTGTSRAIATKSDGDTSWEQGEKSFYLNGSGQPTFVGWGNNYIYSTKAVNDGAWHHVAVVWDYSSGTSGTRKIYVDGVDVTSSSSNYAANQADVTGNLLYIGRPNHGEAPNYFSGSMDEVRIYNRALSVTELAAYYQESASFPTFSSTELTLTTYDEVSAWYAARFTDTMRLYQMDGSHTYSGYQAAPITLQACDTHGHCTTASSSSTLLREEALLEESRALEASEATALSLAASIAAPSNGAVLLSTDPITVSGNATAPRALKDLTVTLDGASIHSANWVETDTITTTSWAFGWTPSAEGQYRLATTVTDWDGGTSTSQPITVTVDTQDPTVTIGSTVLTTTHQLTEGGPVLLQGTASDSMGLAQVEVQIDGGPWQVATLESGSWRLSWLPNPLPDGTSYTVAARATDVAGRTTTISQAVQVDLSLPAAATTALAYQDLQSQLHPLTPGQTVRNASALVLTWSASSDGSGVARYLAGWSQSSTANPADLLSYPGAGTQTQGVGEAQRWYAHLLIRDTLGNTRSETFGPIYVDAPTTPDLVGDLGYEWWMGNRCALLSQDLRLAQRSGEQRQVGPQRFYGGWDAQSLRLAWVGANWQQDGDLFIYLDTQAGGATQLYDPYSTPNTEIFMPGHYPATTPPLPPAVTTSTDADLGVDERARFMQSSQQLAAATIEADYLVWVEDDSLATLLRWDGTQWVTQQTLDGSSFRLNTQRRGPSLEVLLPFTALSITSPATTSISLLAVASEEDALQLWATAPERNPVNSPNVVNPMSALRDEYSFAMIRPITLRTLASGQCANGWLGGGPGAFDESDLKVSLSATPIGTSYGFMQLDLAWLWFELFGIKGGPIPSDVLGFTDINHPLVANGQLLTYQLHYANRGTEAAKGVKVALYGWYSLALPNSVSINNGRAQYKVLDIGTIPPGTEGTLTFTAMIDGALGKQRYDQCVLTNPRPDTCVANQRNASVNAFIYDNRDPLVESEPGKPTLPALEWLWGDHLVDHTPPLMAMTAPLAVIRSGINELQGYAYDGSEVPTIGIEFKNASGLVTARTCTDPTPKDGRWRCQVDFGTLADGASVEVRVNATDEHGHTSPWSLWRTLTVDNTPPTVTGQLDIASGVVGQAAHTLSGQIIDERDIASVEVCRAGGTCEPATVEATSHTTETMSIYDDVPTTPIVLDPSSQCFAGTDIVRTFEVTDDFVIGDVDFGFNADHENRDSIQVTLQAPSGRTSRLLAGPPDSTNPYRNYDVRLSDSSPNSVQGGGHDDTSAPYFDREARPMRPLSAFNGESSKGTWTVRICNGDRDPTRTGSYNRSRLYLGPQTTILYPEGSWSYTVPSTENPDGVRQELGIYGIDRAGNRTTQPVTITYQLDQVAPVLTVTNSITRITPFDQAPTFSGRVTDGSGQAEVALRVLPPRGTMYRLEAAVRDSAWSHALADQLPGTYKVWVEARDAGGNITLVGPYTLEVADLPTLYLPIVSTTPAGVRIGPGNGRLLYLPALSQAPTRGTGQLGK